MKTMSLGNFSMILNRRIIAILLLWLIVPSLEAGEGTPARPGAGDKCPVCGMFVAKYPDWVAQIVFGDGSTVFFDGAKDMFKFYFNLPKYRPQKTQADIRAIRVTDYYAIEPIDGRQAFYVSGSDIYGPMGRELIPFHKEAQAQEFMKDHKGKSVLRFAEIDPAVIKGLDE